MSGMCLSTSKSCSNALLRTVNVSVHKCAVKCNPTVSGCLSGRWQITRTIRVPAKHLPEHTPLSRSATSLITHANVSREPADISVTVTELAEISRRMAQEAKLLDDSLTDAEKLRLGILIGYIKHGLRKTSGGFNILPVPIEIMGSEYSSAKNSTDLKRTKLPLKKFLLQPEEAQFFSMRPNGRHNQVQLNLKPSALIPNPSREMQALLPNVNWDPLPPVETVMKNPSDKKQQGDMGALILDCPPVGTTPSAPQSRYNPEPRQVAAIPVKSKKTLARAVELCRKAKVIAVDCEGSKLSAEGKLCLVQVVVPVNAADAKSNKGYSQCFLFDMVDEIPGTAEMLKDVLEDEAIMKVMHDCRQDAAALQIQADIHLKTIFDTQVAHGLLMHWQSQLVAGTDSQKRRWGLGDLLNWAGLPAHALKSAVTDMMADDPELWQRRPLSSELQQYAAADVSPLLSLADILASKLGEVGHSIVLALSQTSSQMKLPIKVGTEVEDLSKLPANVAVELLLPAAGSADLRPTFVVTQYSGQGDMLLGLDSNSDSSADQAQHSNNEDYGANGIDDDNKGTHNDSAGIGDMLQVLPEALKHAVETYLSASQADARDGSIPRITDIVADVGRPVRLRLSNKQPGPREHALPVMVDMPEALRALTLSQPWLQEDPFVRRNRLSLPGSLHRVSALKSDSGRIHGLTYRIGRHIPGVAAMLMDILVEVAGRSEASSKSLLLLGPPGVGKTTLLRDITQLLADTFQQLLIVVDTSQEIAGGGDIPHCCIGSARCMAGTARQSKHEVLQEAVTNHGPEVIVVDEVYNGKEVAAMADIARRGVSLVATAHGTSLQSLLDNPILNGLVGGKHEVTVGDAQASKAGRKTKQERREAPMFHTVVEMHSHEEWYVYTDVTRSVDALLAGKAASVQLRRHLHGRMLVTNQQTGSQEPSQRQTKSTAGSDWISDLLHASKVVSAS